MEVDVDPVALASAHKEVARDPHRVARLPGAFAKIWNSHWPFATSALMPSCESPAARQSSKCASAISRATLPTFA